MKNVLITLCLILPITSYAQETARGEERAEISPYQTPEVKSSKKLRKRDIRNSYRYQFFKHHEDLVDQFYERIEDNKKKYRKLERKLKKPQYSDPSYFGHKRKPIRRPVNKMKFCKECGIRH